MPNFSNKLIVIFDVAPLVTSLSEKNYDKFFSFLSLNCYPFVWSRFCIEDTNRLISTRKKQFEILHYGECDNMKNIRDLRKFLAKKNAYLLSNPVLLIDDNCESLNRGFFDFSLDLNYYCIGENNFEFDVSLICEKILKFSTEWNNNYLNKLETLQEKKQMRENIGWGN